MNDWSLSPLLRMPTRCARGRPYLYFAQKLDAKLIIARDVMTVIHKKAYQEVWRQSGNGIFAMIVETTKRKLKLHSSLVYRIATNGFIKPTECTFSIVSL
jgi:hypothetical protein